MVEAFTVRGTVIQTPEIDRLEIRRRCVVSVGEDGAILGMRDDPAAAVDVDLPETAFLFPGLVDAHIHAPQWPQMGTGLDLPLERWLLEYTFPLEARYRDLDWAQKVWTDLVSGLLAHGTTAAAYFGTIHVEATTALAETCARLGQRALVGRVAMDHPDQTPEWYRDSDAAAGVDASAASIEEIEALRSPLVRPILTPRFTPGCTDALLEGIGELASATGLPLQTHCSESDWQHRHAMERFGVSDATALDRFGLLRPGSILAHGGHLDAADRALIRSMGAGVAHCPLSNAYFANAVFPARRALAEGTLVALGSDVAGGSSPGLLTQCAMAVTVSQMLEDGVDAGRPAPGRGAPGSRIDTVAAFWMASRGGAAVLGLPSGYLEPGRPFDAFVVDTAEPSTPLAVWPEVDDDRRMFEKIVRLASPLDIRDVWVAGRSVAGRGWDR